MVFMSTPCLSAVQDGFEKIFSSALTALEHDLESLTSWIMRPSAAQWRARRRARDKGQCVDSQLAAPMTGRVTAGHNNSPNTRIVNDAIEDLPSTLTQCVAESRLLRR